MELKWNENEMKKYEYFVNEFSNKNEFLKKIIDIYDIVYKEKFVNILILSKEEFINSVNETVKNILIEQYSSKIYEKTKFISLIQTFYDNIEIEYNEFINELINCNNNFRKEKGKIKIDIKEIRYITRYLKHCSFTDKEAIHNCSSNKKRKGIFIPIFTQKSTLKPNYKNKNYKKRMFNNEINRMNNNSFISNMKYVMCSECYKIYPKNLFLSFCDSCNVNYYSKILNKNEVNDLQPATWDQYHCNSIFFNEEMSCIKCNKIFYIDTRNNLLKCINPKCNLLIKPKNIRWKCKYGSEEFKSGIKIYNELEKNIISYTIKKTLLFHRKALPKYIINDNLDEYYHNKNCNGIVFQGEFNNKKVIVCDKCKEIILYDNFQWDFPCIKKKILNDVNINRYKTKFIDKKNSTNFLGRYGDLNKDIYFSNDNDSSFRSVRSRYKMMNLSRSQNKRDIIKEDSLKPPIPPLQQIKVKRNEILFPKKNNLNLKFLNIKNENKFNKNSNEVKKYEEIKNNDIKENIIKIKPSKYTFYKRINSLNSNNNDSKDKKEKQKENENEKEYYKEKTNQIPSIQNYNRFKMHRAINIKNNFDYNSAGVIKDYSLSQFNRIEEHKKEENNKEENTKENSNEKLKKIEVRKKYNKNRDENKRRRYGDIKIIDIKMNSQNNNENKYLNNKRLLFKRNFEFKINQTKLEAISNSVNVSRHNKALEKNKSYDNKGFHSNNLEKQLTEETEQKLNGIIKEKGISSFDINDYRILKTIGEGTNGIIYEVINKQTDKKYAIKQITSKNIENFENYLLEFEILHSNPHKNIINIIGIYVKCISQSKYSLNILMDLSESDWESDIIKREKESNFYTEKELISILIQLTNVLYFLQKNKNIAHRDIKPENILIFDKNIYKLGDFSEAKISPNSNIVNDLKGTEIYMSPILYNTLKNGIKQVKHNVYKSDMFSFGYCFLYAASLNFDIINTIREFKFQGLVNKILLKMMKPRYSEEFIFLISKMINIEEEERYDFIDLENELKEKYKEFQESK